MQQVSKILAQCDNCDAIFESRLLKGIAGIAHLSLSGNKETCPNCGEMARVADGVFYVAGDMIGMISAPDITRAMYAQFLDLTRKAKSDKIDDSLFIEMADAIDPRLGKAARIVLKNKRAGLLVLLFLWLYMNVNFDIKLDANRLYDQVFGSTGMEFVLPDQSVDDLERNLNRHHPDATQNSPKKQQPEFKPLLPDRKKLLMVSVSYPTLMLGT